MAGTNVGRDRADDVLLSTTRGSCGGVDPVSCTTEYSQDRLAGFADIVSFRTSLRDERLVLRTRVRELDATAAGVLYFTWEIQTSDRVRMAAQIILDRHGLDEPILIGHAGPPRCFDHALDAKLDKSAGSVVLRVPASCLGDVTWIRTGASIVASTPGDPARRWDDDARRGLLTPSSDGSYRPRLGERVVRG